MCRVITPSGGPDDGTGFYRMARWLAAPPQHVPTCRRPQGGAISNEVAPCGSCSTGEISKPSRLREQSSPGATLPSTSDTEGDRHSPLTEYGADLREAPARACSLCHLDRTRNAFIGARRLGIKRVIHIDAGSVLSDPAIQAVLAPGGIRRKSNQGGGFGVFGVWILSGEETFLRRGSRTLLPDISCTRGPEGQGTIRPLLGPGARPPHESRAQVYVQS